MVNISYELSKIKDSFRKVRDDMNFLKSNIVENYEEFKHNHQELTHRVESLTNQLKNQLGEVRNHTVSSNISSKEIHDMSLEIREIKEHVLELEREHGDFSSKLQNKKNNSFENQQFEEVKQKVEATELEVHMLNQRMVEKDLEIKQLRVVNQKLFEIVDELAKAEIELTNRR